MLFIQGDTMKLLCIFCDKRDGIFGIIYCIFPLYGV